MSTTTHYSVQGMKCGGCIKAATDALQELPGYESAEFDLDAGSLVYTGDTPADVVAKTLTDKGYPATPAA
jgi:copper chaperone CopZ